MKWAVLYMSYQKLITLANHSRSYEFEVNFIMRLVDQSQHVLRGLANGRVFHGMASQRKTNFRASWIKKLLIGAVAPLKNDTFYYDLLNFCGTHNMSLGPITLKTFFNFMPVCLGLLWWPIYHIRDINMHGLPWLASPTHQLCGLVRLCVTFVPLNQYNWESTQ